MTTGSGDKALPRGAGDWRSQGRVGFGVAKGGDVQISIQKALHQAKKNVVMLPLVKGTFPHRQEGKFKAAAVIIMPAPAGTGLKSGGATRMLLELAGSERCGDQGVARSEPNQHCQGHAACALQDGGARGCETDAKKAMAERQQKRADATKKVSKAPVRHAAKKTTEPTE